MATNFPGSLDSYSTKNNGDTISEAHINDLQLAIVKIEEKVGTGVTATASTNTALLGTGASNTGYAVINLGNSSLVTGTLTAARGGTGVTNTNTAGGAVILNGSTQLPAVSGALLTNVALSSYDSGWFAVASNTAYTKTHNLASTKLLVTIYGASDSGGSNMTTLGDVREYGGSNYGVAVTNFQTNSVDVRVAQYDAGNGATPRLWNGSAWAVASHVRIIVLALP